MAKTRPKKIKKKITTVREHPTQVPVSEKNPTGVTIRDQHLRRLQGTYLKREDIEIVFKSHNRKGVSFPTPGKISEHKAAKVKVMKRSELNSWSLQTE